MSLDHAPAPHRRDRTGQVRVPVVLPQVDVRIDPDGLLDITVDREPHTADTPLTRDDLHQHAAETADGRAGTVNDEDLLCSLLLHTCTIGREESVTRSSYYLDPGADRPVSATPHHRSAGVP